MGQGVDRVWRPPAPRVERARPFSGEFWRFGPDKGTSIVFGQATRAAGASAARVVDVVSAVRATHSALHYSHACARARDTLRCGVDGGAEAADGRREQQREVSVGCDRHDGNGAGGGSSKARRMIEGDGGGVMGCEGVKAAQHARRGSAMQGGSILPFGV